MRRLDPQDHSSLAVEERIVAAQVLLCEHVDVLCRSLIGTSRFDDDSADHNGPPSILRIDDGNSNPWIWLDVPRLEVADDRIDEDV